MVPAGGSRRRGAPACSGCTSSTTRRRSPAWRSRCSGCRSRRRLRPGRTSGARRGGTRTGCRPSPAAFRAADYGDVEVVRDDPAVAFMQAHERLADIVAAGAAPLVLGGDALVSVPVLQVLTRQASRRLGVVAFTPGLRDRARAAVRAGVAVGAGARARRCLAGEPCARRRAGGSAGRARPPRARRPGRHHVLARRRSARRHGYRRAGGARDGGVRDRGRVPLRRSRRRRRCRRPRRA